MLDAKLALAVGRIGTEMSCWVIYFRIVALVNEESRSRGHGRRCWMGERADDEMDDKEGQRSMDGRNVGRLLDENLDGCWPPKA